MTKETFKETLETFKVTQQPPAGYKKINNGKKVADNIYGRAFQTIFHYLSSSFKEGNGEIMEFGTCLGYSSALIARFMSQLGMTQKRLYLFDSFTGLPDIENPIDLTHYEVSKRTWHEGAMDPTMEVIYANKKLLISATDLFGQSIENIIFRELIEMISPTQLSIVKGYYEDTIDKYFSDIQKDAKLIFANIDCDLYSSSKFVLDKLIEYDLVQDGCVFAFDDYNASRANTNMGQRRAIYEINNSQNRWEFEPWFSYGPQGKVFFLHDNHVGISR